MNFLWHLKAEKSMYLCYLFKYSKEVVVDRFFLYHRFIVLILYFVFLSPLNQSLFVRHRNSYQAILETVSIHEYLVYVLFNLENFLKTSRADVFTVRKFEYVFDPIDDFYWAICVNLANITRMNEAILVKSSVCLFFVFEVSLESILASEADFTLG